MAKCSSKMYLLQMLLCLIGSLLLVNCNYWSNGITTPAQITEIDKKQIPLSINRKKKRKKFITNSLSRNHSIIDRNSNNSYYRNIKPKYPARPVSQHSSSFHSSGGSAIFSNTSISSSPNYRIYSNYNNSIIKSPYNGLKIQESTDVVIYRSVPINCKHHSQSSSNVNYYQLNRERRPTAKPKPKECNCHPNGSISHLCEYRSGQCPCNSNVSGRKCDQCTPGHWNLSANGCADCQCDPIGSINFNCNQYTGQCECKPGVTGKKCTECQIGFFGFNAKGCARCDICQDKGFVCDPFNGRCICPPNTSGWNCMKCAPGTFGWTKHKGCRHCECDTVGSIGSTCDISSGQCSCREGFKGLKCDQCAAGYFGYPKCKRCNCNKDGSLAKNGIFDCDSNGNCHCKASVKGEKCTECIGGTFGLSSEHPDGCISCYCFSRSTKCSSSVWSWGHIRMPNARNLSVNYVHPTTVPRDMYEYIVVVQMEGSRSYQGDSEISFMNDLNLIPSSTGNVSIGAYTQFYHPLYFQLPPQFHGDKTLSYSGKLNYSITASGHTQSLNANVLDKFPLAQIHSHTNLIIDYYSYGSSLASTKSLYSIPLHEAFWKHRSNGKPVDRNTFMIALQNIKHIFLRGSTWTDFREIIIEDVHMDHAVYVEGSSNMIATNIERCECPYKYSGLSCQDPGKGFYRLRDTNSTIVEDLIGHSVPCNCNGRSEDCDRETGACKNCRYNTGGEMCEKCAEGFYGDVNINGCKPCPCPEKSKNFAQGCTVDWRGDVQCICKTAYKGYLCDECSEGYFGSPMSNNGTCEPCQCNEKGIQQIGCHPGTGQCFCKAGIKGLRCDVCDAERHYLDGSSCRVCDNCTLSLLDDTDRISSELKRAMKHIDFSGIPAPWLTLDTYDIRANNLFDTYRNFMDSRIGIEDFNTITLNKMELLSEQEAFNAGFLKKYSTANNTVVLEYLSKIKNHLDFAKSLKDGIIATLHILNNYGNSNNFLNLPSALKQAYFFLQNIEAHENDMHKVKNIISCSTIFHDKFDYLNTELEKSRDDILRINERLKTFNRQVHDIGHLSDKILEDHSEIADILTHVENYIHHFNDNKATLQALLTELDNAQYKNVNQLTKETLNKVKQNLNNMKIVRANLEDIREPTNKSLHANNELYKQVRKHWLPKAWKHTTRLMEKAIKYENLFQPTKDASKMALKASSVYENIIEAIKNAKEAVTEAVESVRSAEMKLYPNHGNSVIYNSKQSLNYSKALQTDAMKKMEQVEHYNKRINHHVEAVETITNTLVNAGNKLNDISLAASTISKHNLRKSISESSHKADDIIDKMKRESQGLTSILDNFSDMKEKLKHLKPATGSRLGGVQDNLTQAFSNIRHAKMDLDDLEVRSKKDSQKFEVWNSSFAKELQELKDSIAQARHAAESIKISIESLDSSCVRSYGPPVLGLSTSNSLKMLFSLNTSSPNSPLLYIEGSQNHFMSLELFRRKIRFVWNLGGKTAEVTHDLEIKPQDPNYAEAWYYIEANRTLNIGSLAVRQMNNYGFLKNSDIVTGSSDSENTRFIRTAKNKIWLGGIPNNSPRNGVMSSGLNVIVNEVFVDNKPLGLWNFDSTKGSCLASKKGAYNPESRSKERYFDGGGYSEVKKTRSRYYRKNLFELQMWFKTLDEDALLFLAIDNKNNRSVSVTLHEGRVIFRVEYGNESRLEINTTNRYNIGSWVKIETAREFKHKRGTENGVLRVNDDIISSGSPNLPIKSHMLPDLSDSVYYLGGVPPGFKSGVTKAPGADNPFMGCMKDITIDRESFDPLETSSLFGVEAGCKTSVSKAGFVGEGFVEYKSHSLRKRSNVGFVFRTLQSESLLLLSAYPPETREDYDTKDIKGNYSISIVDGFINIVVNSGFDLVKLKSNTTVNDGEYHVINLIKMDRRISLMIDDELHSSKTITGSLQTINMPEDSGGLYIGGAPMQTDYSSIVPTTTRLIGAIRDIVINNRTVMFTEALNFSHVLIGRDGPSMGLLDVYMKTEPIGNSFTVAPEGCHRVGSYSYEKNAFKFGDSLNSFSKVFMQGKRFWQGNFEFSFDLRTFYPNGIILFSEGTKNKRKHFVTLILKDGHLNFIMRGRRKEELKLTAKLNNGDWHHISLVCVDRKLTMSVELGKTDQKTSAQLKIGKKISVSNMIYVGGISNNSSDSNMGSDIKNKIGNFKGCLRSFLIDNKARDLAFPENHSNIGQCFPKVEKGSFFAGDAYVLYKKSFNIGKYASFNLNFKTSELNGVIMSGSESPSFPAISLELMDGKVIFSIDTGNTKIQRIESNLPSKYMICDNKWHNLSALYDNEQLILGIDNFSFQTSLNMNPETIQARVNLYIGGLPDSATTGILLGKDNFKGCIKNVIIKNERTDWVDMEELHNVLLSECVVDS
ncbi:LAMA2 family protein [Megaselia abdita]